MRRPRSLEVARLSQLLALFPRLCLETKQNNQEDTHLFLLWYRSIATLSPRHDASHRLRHVLQSLCAMQCLVGYNRRMNGIQLWPKRSDHHYSSSGLQYWCSQASMKSTERSWGHGRRRESNLHWWFLARMTKASNCGPPHKRL